MTTDMMNIDGGDGGKILQVVDVRADDILGMSITSVRERIAFLTERRNLIEQLIDGLMEDGVHYGKVPGTDKPTLLQPGAELLNSTFLVRPEYTTEKCEEDGDHRTYTIRCELFHIPTGRVIGSGRGACSTKEKKYAIRKAGRVCPSCQKPETLKRSKFPPRGNPNALPGWYCYAKAGGCGVEFAHNAREIMEQETGVVANEYLADQYNTVIKMGDKRAFIAATKSAYAVSDRFSQDQEDDDEDDAATANKRAAASTSKPVRRDDEAPRTEGPGGQQQEIRTDPDLVINDGQQKRLWSIAREHKWTEEQVHDLISGYQYNSTKAVKIGQYEEIINKLKQGAAVALKAKPAA